MVPPFVSCALAALQREVIRLWRGRAQASICYRLNLYEASPSWIRERERITVKMLYTHAEGNYASPGATYQGRIYDRHDGAAP